VLQNTKIDDSAQVVNVGKEENLDATLNELLEDTGVVKRFKDISMSGRIPIRDRRVEGLWCWEQRILENSWVAGLVEGQDVDVVALVFLDDVLGIIVSVEGVHENEWDVDIICAVEVFDLSNRQIEEGHAIADFDNGFGTNATHGCTKTTVELEHSKLVQETNRFGVGELVVVNNLRSRRWGNTLPVTTNNLVPYICVCTNSIAHSVFPLALSFKYLRKSAKKLSISVSKS
jgi:hypothetical protein